MIDQTLNNRYRITARLGAGAMGEVYRATDTQTSQDVAVKVLARHLTLDRDMVERFRREGEALRQLRHPNIVGVADTFQHDGQQVIVLEFVSGGSLHQLIQRGPLPLDQVRRIGLELCDALTRAHHLRIIHRDLKPENVLLTPDGTPKLTDFGVARLVGEGTRLTGTGTQVGTPFYMSPEAWQGLPLDGQTDIWSLGVMLYEMLTGQVPFGGDTLVAVMNKVLTAPLPDVKSQRPDTPPEMVKIVRKMLARDKARRYQTVREVALDLERVAEVKTEGRAPAALRTETAAPSAESSRVEPPMAATQAGRAGGLAVLGLAGVAVVVVLLGAGALGWWGLSRANAASRATQTALVAAIGPTQTALAEAQAPTETPAAPALAPSPMPLPTATLDSTATAARQETALTLTPSAAPTQRPTLSPTPLPSWVTDFAQPILTAIAGRNPSFEDSFSSSNGWEGCGAGQMSYKTGALVLAGCTVNHANIDYPDVAVSVEGQLAPDGPGTSWWELKYRDSQILGGCAYFINVATNGNIRLGGQPKGQDRNIQGMALSAGMWNHLTVIAKGSQFAVFVNDRPIYYGEDTTCRYGTVTLRASDYFGRATGTVMLRNFKLWNIAKLGPAAPTASP